MANINDFQPSAVQNEFGDFILETESVKVNSPKSNTNMAAYAAALGPSDQVESSFRTVKSEAENENVSLTSNQIMDMVRQKNFASSRQALVDFLADPQVPFEEKEVATQNFIEETSRVMGFRDLLSKEVALADSPGETEEAEFVRVDGAAQIEAVNEYNRYVQSIINKQEAATDSNMFESVANFVELLAPFVEGGQLVRINEEFKSGEYNAADFAKNMALLGNSKEEIRDAIRSLPPEDRMPIIENIVDIVNNHKGIVLTDDNDFARMDTLRTFLEEGYYDDGDALIDNAISMLDMTILGAPVAAIIGRGARGLRAAARGADEAKALEEAAVSLESKAGKDSVRSDVSPVSVSQNYKDYNPEKSRAVHDLAIADEAGEAASAAYGTSRGEAAASDLFPEVGSSGVVKNKTGNIDKNYKAANTPDPDLMDFSNNDGAIYYWKEDKIAMRSDVVHDFRNAAGMTARTEMFQIEELSDGVQVYGVYGTKEGGFREAQDALDVARFSLKDYGVTEDQLQLLQRVGNQYVPVDKASATGSDFLVSIDYRYKFNPADLVDPVHADVKNNLLDRFTPLTDGSHGSFQRFLVDAGSMLHPNLTFGASVASDKATGLEKAFADLGRQFAKTYAKLPKDRRGKMERFIKEANDQGIGYNDVILKARGFNETERKALKDWRRAWDTHYWLENRDLARTLKARGYKVIEDAATETKLYAKPVANRGLGNGVKVYDYTDDTVKVISRDKIDELYKEGGTLAELRSKIVRGDDMAEFVISAEKMDGPYLRALNDNDQVLQYRQGYYQVQYKDPQFVVQVVKDSKGNKLYEKAIATAPNIEEANIMARRMSNTNGGEYFVRGDVKGGGGYKSTSEDYWDIASASGRISQQARGQRLEDSTMQMAGLSHANILDPVEALTVSIRSTSRRVSTRDYLEATKARFLKQFEEVLPKNKFGQPMFPEDRRDIGGKGKISNKKVADARTTYEYIRYIENGYVNAIDDTYKAILNDIADLVGSLEKGRVTQKTEEGLRAAAKASPSQSGKGLAFKAYLALNPLRQAIVQSHQSVRLSFIAPTYVAGGKMGKDLTVLAMGLRDIPVNNKMLKWAGYSREEFTKMVDDFRKSGLAEAVDANNLVRGDLKKLADYNLAGKLGGIAAKPLEISQRIGFDFGEQVNMTTSWLTHRHLAIQEGKKLDNETMDMVSAQARNFTYNMNFAGDMPYNQNFASLPLQFLQVPHKAFLQYFNRGLPRGTRARLATLDAIAWGVVPTGVATALFGEFMPEDPTTRDLITQGVEQVLLNEMFSTLAGDDTRLNFSGSLAPSDMTGLWSFVGELWLTDAGQLISESPSGQLLFGNNPRLTRAFKTAARYMNLVDDYEDPTEFSDVAKEFARISSGWSNAEKAIYAMKYGEKMNSLGNTSDYNVTPTEAFMAAFGIETMDEYSDRFVNEKLYKTRKELNDRVDQHYKDFKAHMANNSYTADQMDFVVKAYSEAWRVWGNDNQAARDRFFQLIQRDIDRNDYTMFESLQRSAGFLTPEELKGLAELSSLNQDEKRVTREVLENIKKGQED